MTYSRTLLVIAILSMAGTAAAADCSYRLRAAPEKFWSLDNRKHDAPNDAPWKTEKDTGLLGCMKLAAVDYADKLGTKKGDLTIGAIDFKWEGDNVTWTGWILKNTEGRSKAVKPCLTTELQGILDTLFQYSEQTGYSGLDCADWLSWVQTYSGIGDVLIEITAKPK
ncbi:MAG: hypothetical protein V1495_00950 [Pseudomonadota bacterium]